MKSSIRQSVHRFHRHYPMIFFLVQPNAIRAGKKKCLGFFGCVNNSFVRSAKCQLAVHHEKDDRPHQCSTRCLYNKDLDNEVWKCLQCQRQGRDTIVYGKLITKNDNLVQGLLKYVWSGCVIECPFHGEIYRSRKHWYGNNEPKDVTVIEIIHVWPDDDHSRLASDVTPRKFMELIVYASRSVNLVDR